MLQIKKITNKVWLHVDTTDGEFILSKFYLKNEFDKARVVEVYGSKRREYAINEIEVYDIGGGAETFGTFTALFTRLEELNYTGFYTDGEIVPSSLISVDSPNAIVLGSDGKLKVVAGDAQVYKTVNSNTNLDDSYHNAIVWVTATCTITIPSGLRADFACTLKTFSGATATYATSGTTINAESDGSTQAASSLVLIATYTTNDFIISGGGLS